MNIEYSDETLKPLEKHMSALICGNNVDKINKYNIFSPLKLIEVALVVHISTILLKRKQE